MTNVWREEADGFSKAEAEAAATLWFIFNARAAGHIILYRIYDENLTCFL